MAKWCGKIGYGLTIETEPGIYEDSITERVYYGDLMRNTTRRTISSNSVNDNISLSNTLSILSDPFAMDNFSNIRYVEIFGNKWKITDVEVAFPRLLLTIGGVYNGEQA